MPELEDDDEWEVEEVKDERQGKEGTSHFLIKWKDWPTEYNTWEPEENMANAQGAIRAFRKQRAKKAKNT